MIEVNVKANVKAAVPVTLPSEASFQSYILQMQALLANAESTIQQLVANSEKDIDDAINASKSTLQNYVNQGNEILQDTINHSNPLAAYPVGSYYFSSNATSPADLFGGTWEQLEQGRVLLSQGSKYPAGSKGGEATHTLTVAEMPAVDGSFPCTVVPNHAHYIRGVAYATTFTGMTAIVNGQNEKVKIVNGDTLGFTYNVYGYGIKFGEDKPHNNLQPYLSVYIWRRVS